MSGILLAEAVQIAAAVVEAAERDGTKVGVVVVDAGGNLVLAQRMDGAYLSVLEIATKKAFSAVNFGRPTYEMAQRLGDASYQSLLSLADGRLTFLRGGLPVRSSGVVVGGVGVSGGSAAQDEAYAEQALHATGLV